MIDYLVAYPNIPILNSKDMDTPLLITMLSCFTCCLFFFHVVLGVHDVGGNDLIHTVRPHQCLDEERSALWEFKQGLNITRYNGSASYHRTDSWKAGGDCCSGWDGVECDQLTGHVIGLDLSWNQTSWNWINGSISGNSTLFQLFHLQKLDLSYNALRGQIPSSIFHLSNLSSLDLSDNNMLELHRPSLKDLVDNFTKLEHLHLDGIDMAGSALPDSLSNYSRLKSLSLSECRLRGKLSVLSTLTKLSSLDLSKNQLTGQIPSSLSTLSGLVHLVLSDNQLTGQIPSSLSVLTKLVTLSLHHNQLSGSIPSLTSLTDLQYIDLSFNLLEGTLSNSFSHLSNLRSLVLSSNNLNGTVELGTFHKLRDLSVLDLSQNNLTLLVNEDTNSVVLDKYISLGLSSCNLSKFPAFLLNQSKLEWLDLSQNSIHGIVPAWIWNHSLSIDSLDISHNFLATIEDPPIMFPQCILRMLDISFNMLQGSLPVPSSSTKIYFASDNRWSGHLSPLFCNSSHLSVLDVSNNNISGTIPQCLGTYLSILDLRNNKLHGTIPESWMFGSYLKMIALSQNQLQGKLPRSLVNCTKLEFIDIGNNQIVDTFPSWLGSLPELNVLMLQSNSFHGEIHNSGGNTQFAKLQILDLSFNDFSGKLPSMYFQSLKCMQSLDANNMMEYMETPMELDWSAIGAYEITLIRPYGYSMKISNKGMERLYSKIPNLFKGIDFSHNQFEGEIPASIAKLRGLHFLNLGHNNLTGTIPSWLGNLQQLESLDLSHNKLSGKIPQELSQLSFLSFFNVSCNNLSGIIPHGGQFDTFDSSSYEGNPGLLAYHPTQPPTLTPKTGEKEEEEEEDEPVFDRIEWMVILMGCGSGLIVGVVLGNELVARKPLWFVKLLGRWL